MLAIAGVLVLGSAGVAWAKPCPALIGVAGSGAIYEERGGAWVRQSPATVEAVLKAGCYPEGGPSPTSSVRLVIAPGAPKQRVELVYGVLARAGWAKEKVETAVWKNSPQEPR